MRKVRIPGFVGVFAVIVFLVMSVPSDAADLKNQKPSRFKVTYSITYNSLDLEESAAIERRIRKEHGDGACDVKVDIGTQQSSGTLTYTLNAD